LQNAVPANTREQAKSRRGAKLYGLDFSIEAPFWLLKAVNGHGCEEIGFLSNFELQENPVVLGWHGSGLSSSLESQTEAAQPPASLGGDTVFGGMLRFVSYWGIRKGRPIA
jgi:hypothetical protein